MKTYKIMLLITAIFLFMLWTVIFIGFKVGGVVHSLLMLVLISIMLRKAVEKRQYKESEQFKWKSKDSNRATGQTLQG